MHSGYEGRAGMAAIVLKQDLKLDGKKLYEHLVKTLPPYAWPRFLRIQVSRSDVFTRLFNMRSYCSPFSSACSQTRVDVTETFKQQKRKLVQEGFNPDLTLDPLYFLDVSQKDYIPLTSVLYQDIVSAKTHL